MHNKETLMYNLQIGVYNAKQLFNVQHLAKIIAHSFKHLPKVVK